MHAFVMGNLQLDLFSRPGIAGALAEENAPAQSGTQVFVAAVAQGSLAAKLFPRKGGGSYDQFDLFAYVDTDRQASTNVPQAAAPIDVGALSDSELLTAIPSSGVATYRALTEEAARRRLPGAVAALAALCRRFSGFGAERVVLEQVAALNALASIGGDEAAQAVARMIERGEIQGPGLRTALLAASRLGATLSNDLVLALLGHEDATIRADACGWARPLPAMLAIVRGLLKDPDTKVAQAAALALGRLGHGEALPRLKDLLRSKPSIEAIEAVLEVADDECLVLLARLARSTPRLAAKVLWVLDELDLPRAATIAAALRRDLAVDSPQSA